MNIQRFGLICLTILVPPRELTVSKAIWNRDAKNGRTKDGSTYDRIEVAAATVSERCSFLLYWPRSISLKMLLTKEALSTCPRKSSDCSPLSFLLNQKFQSNGSGMCSIKFRILVRDTWFLLLLTLQAFLKRSYQVEQKSFKGICPAATIGRVVIPKKMKWWLIETYIINKKQFDREEQEQWKFRKQTVPRGWPISQNTVVLNLQVLVDKPALMLIETTKGSFWKHDNGIHLGLSEKTLQLI